MKGLLRKDLLMMKDNYKGFGVFLLLYIVLGFAAQNTGPLTGVLAIIMMMIPVSSLQVDEYYHWDQYVLTLPVSRKMVVQSKYLFCLLTMAVIFLIAVLFEILINNNVTEALYSSVVLVSVAMVINAAALPCVLKWGAMRGRFVIMVLCGFAGAIMMIFGLTVIMPQRVEHMPQMPGEHVVESAVNGEMLEVLLNSGLISVLLLAAAVFATVISYKFSCRIYEKREL